MLRAGLLVLTILLLAPAAGSTAALGLADCRINAGPAFPSIKARCGTLARPLNPDDPDGESIELSIAVVPALNLDPEPDPIVPLAGGPGQGAIMFYASYASAFEYARRNRDIVLVDQRGTGDSANLACSINEELASGQYSVATTIKYTKECLESLPFDPRYFTTTVAVTDLEAVREALGYSQLNLYGVSYGSRVAQHYARRYPESVRTITLDGVVPPQLPLGPDIAIESQAALERIFARCAEDADCSASFPDLNDRFAALLAKLKARAVKLKAAHPITGHYESVSFGRDELAAALRLLAYHPNTIAMMPLLINEAANGNYRPLIAQYQMTLTSLSESISLGMHNAVMCSEDAPYYEGMSVDSAALGATYMGTMQFDALKAICSVWPAGPVDEDLRQPLNTDIPSLLLSGSADPITPPKYADMAAIGLQRAWLLTMPHQGHGQISVGCIPRLFEKFVVDASLENVDLECRDRSFVMPFFLDFAGPAP